MPQWTPKTSILEQDIAEEEARILALKYKRAVSEPVWEPQPVVEPVVPEMGTIEPDLGTMETAPIRYSDVQFAESPQWQPPQPQYSLPQPVLPISETAPISETLAQKTEQTPWLKPGAQTWEQPAQIAEKGMELVGQGISKIPLLPKALSFIAPVFEWISENLEKPFASIATSPFSPNLPWRQGESWLEHEKREYKEWEAPTYVKGASEFAMPLWWIPWLGWGGKGLKAIGAGNRAIAAVDKLAPAISKLSLPTKQVLDDTLFKKDFFKTVALWSENKPVLSQAVKAIGGPAAFVKPEALLPLDTVKQALVRRSVIYNMRNGARAAFIPKLQTLGDARKILGIDAQGIVGAATPKSGFENLGRGLSEVFEHPEAYTFATKEAKAYVETGRQILRDVYELAEKEGVKIPKDISYHRIVAARELKPEALARIAKEQGITIDQLQLKLGEKSLEKSEYGSLFEVARHHKTMEEGIKAGVQYGTDPLETIGSTVNHYFKKIADKRLADEIKPLGKTPAEKWASLYAEDAVRLSDLITRKGSANYALQAVKRIVSFKGASVPGATFAKIRNELPDIASRIDRAFQVAPGDVTKILSSISDDFWKAAKITPKELNRDIATISKVNEAWRGQKMITATDITEALEALNVDKKLAVGAVEQLYKSAYRSSSTVSRNLIKTIEGDIQNILTATKSELKPITSARNKFLREYREGRQILGTGEAVFSRVPAFRGMVFDKDIVGLVEKTLGDKGIGWLRTAAQTSGLGRMLIAALDLSAPFIQGLPVLGRNPVAWGKGVIKQLEFFTKPENLYKYMADPVNMATRLERISYGGASGTFEYFQAMSGLQNIAGKVPKAGGVIQAGIRGTYGRAEAAFTGFGEVARNEMWKALKRQNMPDTELRELARTIDRMTGVMSMEALGMTRSQIDFENAFVFFAPRYTRAGLSYVGDVLKGGISGAEARKSLASLAGAGAVMYYGISKILGQQPNFDPTSGRFMTLKIGDAYMGLGGTVYALTRLGANIIGTGVENPADLVALLRDGKPNRDNPFVKFMLSKTSPLTGTLTNIIENKNYLGEPFESPADWGRYMAEKVTPISLQTALFDERQRSPAVFAAEFGGMRTFPKSAWELREDSREHYAQENYGQPFTMLPKTVQNQIDQNQDIQALQQEADRSTEIRGGLSSKFLQRQGERDTVRQNYIETLTKWQNAVEMGLMTSYDFREEMQKAGYGLAMTYDHIDKQYPDVMAKLNEPKEISNKYVGDIAFDEYAGNLYSGQFEDQYGIFNFDAYNKYKDDFRQKWGDEIWSYVQQREQESRKDLPALAQELYKAKDALKPYWAVADNVAKLYGKTFAESKRGQSFISKQRKIMRQTNPEIAKAYETFYRG